MPSRQFTRLLAGTARSLPTWMPPRARAATSRPGQTGRLRATPTGRRG
jgi:hypothetical protein